MQRVHGVRHFSIQLVGDGQPPGDSQRSTHLIEVNLRDPHVRLQTVLSSRDGIECNSVNHNGPGKDPHHSNCAPPYPLEPIGDMLRRYRASHGVAIINTDYFGPDGDHGAQGLAVRNGVRLDGRKHGVRNNLATISPSLAISSNKRARIGKPRWNWEIELNLRHKYHNVVGGGPILVANSKIIPTPCAHRPPSYADTCQGAYHSAAGLTHDGRLILMTSGEGLDAMTEYLVSHYAVHSAMKFDGGRSSSMAWLDHEGNIQEFFPSGVRREVAQGLLVASQQI